MLEREEELKGLLRKVKEETEKAALKLIIQKTKHPVPSQTLFTWSPKSMQVVTVDVKLKDACSLEEKL